MDYLRCPTQNYAWGSTGVIADLLGIADDGTPRAELWMGAHRSAPATINGVGLDGVIADDPATTVGHDSAERFGARLAFLFKFLSAASPLSLQVHPSAQQAASGFALEEKAGVPIDAPHRRYKDPFHKPELLVALSPFVALCGLRPLRDTEILLNELGVAEHPAYVGLADRGIKAVIGDLLHKVVPPPSPEDLKPSDWPEGGWLQTLSALYPGDPGVGISLLLNLIELAPGEAVYLPAGNMHAYLRGDGLEIMASSDNVLRCGLTPKFIDVDEMLTILDVTPTIDPVIRPAVDGSLRSWTTPAEEFSLRCIDNGVLRLPGGAPTVVLGLTGETVVSTTNDSKTVARGQVLWIPASERAELETHGICAVATTNISASVTI